MNRQKRIGKGVRIALLGIYAAWTLPGWAQTTPAETVNLDQPDAQRTREELQAMLDHYPPALHSVLSLDPGLLGNQTYLAPYPVLVSFLNRHPEIARNPAFYVGEGIGSRASRDPSSRVLDMWQDALNGFAIFAGFGLAVGLLVWLIRTLVDYRRWSRLAKVQTDAHTKLLDRFTANEDLLAYIQSPAGSKFLQSSPIALDAAPRNVSAPLGRILWSVQGGVVLIAGGLGLHLVSQRITDNTSQQSIHALGILAIALGFGFVVSAAISFAISRRLGIIETSTTPARTELPGT